MPYQAHLQEAGRFLAHQGREPGTFARLVALTLLLWLPVLAWPVAAQTCQPRVEAVAAAQELDGSGMPPVEGWVAVTLPDTWTQRWPQFSGSVWYRIQWRDECAGDTSIAVAVDHVIMAGMAYSNDDLLWRDESLVEPLSRSWNMPRYWLLPASSLLPQENTLWFRVTGMAHEMPGLGRVVVGDPALVWSLHEQQRWQQRHLFVANLTVSLVLGCLFLAVWVMRRSESAFGWYALASLAWVVFISNTLVSSPWPFPSSEHWSRLNLMALAIYCSAFCMFTWTFGGQRFSRLVRWLWAVTAAVATLVWLVPLAWLEAFLLSTALGYTLIFLANCVQFQFHAWRNRQLHNVLLAICLLVFLAITLHDGLAFLRLIDSERSYTPLSTPVAMICMFLIIAWSFAGNLRRIETFNEQLQTVVEDTRTQLTRTLLREHQLEVSNIRLNERLRISHDLHDSLGSSLMRSIAMVEQAGPRLGSGQFLPMLKELRDDLRQIIDSSSGGSANVNTPPAEWLAPLRHRFVRLFEELELASCWKLPQHWPCQLSSVQLLALTRFVEEALSNVIKHSHATCLHVEMQALPSGGLSLCVADNGVGFDVDTTLRTGTGIGMQSMHARIERIGGRLDIESGQGGTMLRVSLHGERGGSVPAPSVSADREAPPT